MKSHELVALLARHIFDAADSAPDPDDESIVVDFAIEHAAEELASTDKRAADALDESAAVRWLCEQLLAFHRRAGDR